MAKVKIFLDPIGNTLNMWWDDPKTAYESEEAELSNDVIIKNKKGQPIGLEIIGFFPKELDPLKFLKSPHTLLLTP